MKLPKSFVVAEEKRIDLYEELKVPLNADPKWIENTDEIPPSTDFGLEREEPEI